MTIADQLRSFPVPPRHVLIAAATVIERLNLNLVSMQQFTDQIKTECRELRAENERLTAEAVLLKGCIASDDERSIAAALKADVPPMGCDTADHLADIVLALRRWVTELDQQRESAFRAGYTYGCAEERVNCDFAWKMCSGQL